MFIGIDLGGTNIAGGLTDREGTVCFRASRPTLPERGFERVAEDIAALIDELERASLAEGFGPVLAIGIGIPGIAEPRSGLVRACVNLGWIDVPLGSYLADRFPQPIRIDNDATVAAAAEFLIAQRGAYRSAVLLTLGTGVGSGVMIDGKIIAGAHGIGGEIGHMIVGESLRDCNCGRNGCLETFVSATAIIAHAKRLLSGSDRASLLRGAEIDGESVFSAAKRGDRIADEVVERMTHYLAVGVMNIVSVIDPEIVLIGGGLSLAGDFLIDRLREKVRTLRYFRSAPIPKIETAKLRNDAGIVGAAICGKMLLQQGEYK